MPTRRALPLASLALVTSLVAAACSSPEVEEAPAVTTTASPTAVERTSPPSPSPAPVGPEVAWPLTGIDAEGADADALARPALSIKIENTSQARPQENIDHADIVFEEQVEYGISRLVAVFQSDVPETVGPIRSMRPMDKNIVGSLGGPLVFSGAQRGFINEAAATGMDLIAQDTGGYGFYRTSDKPAPHNLHGRTADFYEQTDADAPPAQFDYAYEPDEATPVAEGTTATSIDIYASPLMQPEWDWDASAGSWMRSENGTAHVTADGTQLSTTNVVVLWVDIVSNSNGGGSAVPETLVVTDSGTGYAVAGDSSIPITWSKAGQFDPYVLTTEAGDPVTLLPGKTWVELIPQSGGAGKGTVTIN